MVIPATSIPRQELRTANGEVFAHVIQADEFARMQAEMEELRKQVATLTRQKARYIAELNDVLKKSIPIPPSEEALAAMTPNSEELQKLIAELESR
jgi:ABC-type phosphate transport system auxiliary subunit